MGRSRDRVFRNAVAGRKVSRHEIRVVSRGGDRYSKRMQLFQLGEIGPDVLNCRRSFVDRNVGIVCLQHRRWKRSPSQTRKKEVGWMKAGCWEHRR